MSAGTTSWHRIMRLPRVPISRSDERAADNRHGRLLRGLRRAAVTAYLIVLCWSWSTFGVPFARTDLLLWLAGGLAACCVGRRPVWLLWLVIDFVPLAAVLIAYDYLRGVSDDIGLPTWWHPQVDVDRVLFAGTEPTVWLQEHLKHPDVRWYDVLACACYYSFFFLPYLTAAVLWLRGRADFYRWSLRFVALSFVGFACFVLVPAAPPWAAALCTPAQVTGHPNDPGCLHGPAHAVVGNVLGAYGTPLPGAKPYLERIVARGFGELHLGVANTLLVEGRVRADAVAAVPSLHLGGTVLFVLFMWPRVRRAWRPLLVGYPLLMTLSLVYTGEHYVVDCVAGALVAWAVHAAANRVERRKRKTVVAPAPVTLEVPSA